MFNANVFTTRSHCGLWEPWLITLNQAANLLIFLAYFTIPLSLLSLWRLAKDHPALKGDGWIILAFVFFILSCGLTHLMNVLAFSWAPYRLFTVVDVVTAFLLPGVLKRLFLAGNPE